jgi:hypothetical protein
VFKKMSAIDIPSATRSARDVPAALRGTGARAEAGTAAHARCRLDRRAADAREIGDEAYTGLHDHFSVDWFLDVRCCVVANGKRTFETVLKNPKRMPKGMEFEALLQVAAQAYQAKTGEDFAFIPSVSYETFSNKAGWQ